MKEPTHPIQQIMSRTGSFPLTVAYSLLRKFGPQKQAIVFDPFAGKGTTLLAARFLGYSAYGMDIAPEAVICCQSKMLDISREQVIDYIDHLKITKRSINHVPAEVKVFFHPDTLAEILGIREMLFADIKSTKREKTTAATFSLAALLGILHGHASYSLSVSSAHAYSMSPSYVLKYSKKHGLAALKKNVKECLINKASIVLSIPLPPAVNSEVKKGDALSCSQYFKNLIGKVDLVLTSPPYLNAQTYAKDNWLRHWLLGYDYKKLHNDYIETGSINKYADMMRTVFKEINIMLKSNGTLIFIAGDIRINRQKINKHKLIFQTARFLSRVCKSACPDLSIIEFGKQVVPSERRYLHALSESIGHSKRCLFERVFIAKRKS
jgi:site-specific DNA-methyltransferase (adenine-specific)